MGYAEPCRCFTLVTAKRTYDFICKTDEQVEMFVLSVSRLCRRKRGYQVHGAIERPMEFAAARGWCKVEESCKRKNLTLIEAMKSEVMKSACRSADGKSGGRVGPL